MATRFAKLVLFTFVIALINYATASPFERRADQCFAMTDVKNAFKQDANFCNFWLAAKRKNSPIPNVKPSDVSSACKCITSTASPTSKTIKAATPKPTACATKKDPYYSAMLADIASPAAFCDFWFLDPHRYRTVVPGVSPKQLSSICSCITTSPKPSSTTRTTTSSTTSSHTTATSTPAETTAAAPAATSTSASATQTATSSSSSSDSSSSSSTSSASASASQDASSDSSSSSSSTSTTTSSTSTSTASDSPTPKSDAAICPALSGDTLVDPSGTSYAMQCDKTYSGTVISGGSRKRQAVYTIENCLTACNGVVDCVAVSVLNGACTMLSDVNGYSTQSGGAAALNEVRAEAAGITEDAIPSLDPPASSSSSSTSTSSSPATTETSSDTPSDGSDGSSTSTAIATVTATEPSSPSTPADTDSGSSDSTSSSATATVTMPAAGASNDGSSDTSSISSSSTTSAAPQLTESSTPLTGDDSESDSSNSSNTQTATGTQSAAAGDSTASASPDTTSSTAPTETQSTPADSGSSDSTNTSSSAAPTETQSTPADSGSSDSTSTSASASATASSNPVSDNLLGCSAPASSTIDGLPAVACGAGFDQALNDVLGYYSGDAADVAAVEASIIPGLSSSSIQKRALTETIQTVAKDAISTILAAAQSVMDSIVAALPGDVKTAEADVAEVSNKVADSGVAQQVALKRGLDSVHKPGTQWKFARHAEDVPVQQLYATGLATGVSTSTATPSSSSGTAPVSSSPTIVASGTAPTMMSNSTTFQIIPTGTAPTQAVNQTTSGLVGTGTAPAIIASSNQTQAFPTAGTSTSVSIPLNTAPVSTSTMAGNQTVVLSTGGLVASTTSSIPLLTGSVPSATSAPVNGTVPSQTETSTTAPSSSIPSPSSNATAPTTDKINSAPITITDTTKSLLLQPASDGSLFVSTNNADVSSLTSSTFVWDQTNDVVFGDSSSRLLHYFPSELFSLGASRFRLAGWGDIPIGASLLNLVPFQTDAASDPVLVAVDSLGNYLWPFACGLQGQTNKVFLVSDLANGASILENSDLVYTIVGGVAQNCAPLALTGNGMTGI